MNNDKYLSLYAVESRVGEKRTCLEGQDYHSFIVLRDETPGQDPAIVEKLSFKMQLEGLSEGQKPYLILDTKTPEKQKDFKSSDLKKGYIGTMDTSVMSSAWEHAIEVGEKITALEKELSAENHINCRAGVKAVIDSLGLVFDPVTRDGKGVLIGTESNLIDEIDVEPFDFNHS